jgi:hypothetical protein
LVGLSCYLSPTRLSRHAGSGGGCVAKRSERSSGRRWR